MSAGTGILHSEKNRSWGLQIRRDHKSHDERGGWIHVKHTKQDLAQTAAPDAILDATSWRSALAAETLRCGPQRKES